MSIISHGARLAGATILPKVSYYRGLVDKYTKFFINETVEKNTILYESRDGKSMTDSPLAIFEYLLKVDKEQSYTHIWSVTKNEELEKIKSLYKDHKNVIFVTRNSESYLKWLAKAEYLINNSTFQPFVTIKENQTYINTWHGTPLKTMGFDIPGNPANAKNVVRNFYMADFLISPNHHTTNMFLKSYRLNDNYSGKIIESGYPRIDQTFDKNKDELLKLLFDFDITLDLSKKIMLYTPTCKLNDPATFSDEVKQIQSEMELVREKFDDSYNVLVKVHPFLYDEAKKNVALRPFLIPDVIDTNKLLGITDLLITDYSSIFFDYLVTDKPILFYCWDDDLYSNQRGKYFEYEELPGAVAFNIDELLVNIENLENDVTNYQANYDKCKEKFVCYDDGFVTERIINIIFNKKDLSNVVLIEPDTTKKSLLIYPGGLRNNGITSSFLNLMQSIDYNQYRVVLLLDNLSMPEQIKNISSVPENVTVLFRYDVPLFTIKEHYRDLKIHFNGVRKGKEEKYPDEIYRRELNRLIGTPTFDVAIDFSGYSLNWSKLVLASQAKHYVCYLHSDMKLDQERTVNGKKIHKINLLGQFSVYNRYDKLVSVSESIMEINKAQLKDYASVEKFTYATNTINIEKILTTNAQTATVKKVSQTIMFIRSGRLNSPEKKLRIQSTRPDMQLGSVQEKCLTSDEVSILGEFVYQDETYYKMSQDHIYLGWIKAKEVTVYPVSILSEKSVSNFGKLNTYVDDKFYSEPIGLEKSVPLSSAEKLRNVYVDVTKEVITEESTSILVTLKGKELGWLPKNKMTWSKKLSPNKKANLIIKTLRQVVKVANHLQHKNKVEEIKMRPLKKEILSAYYRQVDVKELKAYENPIETSNAIQLGKVEVLFVNSLSTTSEGRWFEIITEDHKILWVKEESITLTSLKNEEIICEQDVMYRATSKEILITAYSTLSDCLENKGQEIKALPHYQVIKKAKTSLEREFLLVNYEERKLWVGKENLTIEEVTGITNAEGQLFTYPNPDVTNIVTVGRLSPEKNQIVLIQAFNEYQKTYPESHLYIIGAGVEAPKLDKEINALGLEEKVTMLGQVYNPFDFMKHCDIFALTSLYEGQSLVLVEALTLQMKCVSTDIPACRDVLQNGEYGVLTRTNDVQGVAEGLKEITAKDNKERGAFDPYIYNKKATEMFIDILE
ncbi:CDP-glycerol glycerophosphotransferase family protein [Vagococcus fluvialis]|uniref:CDP-glycerol glycerophosphotransferase family protein n=1 Tax=Vagococcus fluvialis TaxID=2738 RepID=UPI003D0AA8EA